MLNPLDLQTRSDEIEELLRTYAEEKKMLKPNQVMEVKVCIRTLSPVSVKIDGYGGLTDMNLMLIRDLGLRVRTLNALSNADFKTVGQLREKTRDQMLKIRNLGRNSMDEARTALKSIGVDVVW